MAKLNVTSVYKVAREVRAGDSAQVDVVLAGDRAADLAALLGGGPAVAPPAALRVLPHGSGSDLSKDDIVVLMADDAAAQAIIGAVRRARARLVVVLPPAGGPAAHEAARQAGAYDDELVFADPATPWAMPKLAAAVARVAGAHGPALGCRLPAVRDAVVRRLVQRAARQNAAVGAVVWVPGADMPVMTLNQVRMVLQIGAAYGEDVGPQRAPEVLAVVGAGLGLRTAAREALGFVPVAGWALKGVLGYAGTLALGRAAVKYYESGALPVDPSRVKGLLSKLARRGKVQAD
jgi:uncharacterized protein (DUF697 family)